MRFRRALSETLPEVLKPETTTGCVPSTVIFTRGALRKPVKRSTSSVILFAERRGSLNI